MPNEKGIVKSGEMIKQLSTQFVVGPFKFLSLLEDIGM